MRALPQPRSALTAIPPEPLVAGLAADPILPAQRCHLILARQNPSDKLRPFVHLTGLSPRHRQAPLPPTVQTCHLSTRSTLLPIYPAHTGDTPSPRKRGKVIGLFHEPAVADYQRLAGQGVGLEAGAEQHR